MAMRKKVAVAARRWHDQVPSCVRVGFFWMPLFPLRVQKTGHNDHWGTLKSTLPLGMHCSVAQAEINRESGARKGIWD